MIHCSDCRGQAYGPAVPGAIASAADVARLLADLVDAEQEQVVVLCLDAKNVVTHRALVAMGSLSERSVAPRDVFREAVRRNARAVIVAHNHPSGDPAPSTADKALTAKLVAGGELLGIPILDHVIIGRGRHFSFADSGLL